MSATATVNGKKTDTMKGLSGNFEFRAKGQFDRVETYHWENNSQPPFRVDKETRTPTRWSAVIKGSYSVGPKGELIYDLNMPPDVIDDGRVTLATPEFEVPFMKKVKAGVALSGEGEWKVNVSAKMKVRTFFDDRTVTIDIVFTAVWYKTWSSKFAIAYGPIESPSLNWSGTKILAQAETKSARLTLICR